MTYYDFVKDYMGVEEAEINNNGESQVIFRKNFKKFLK